MRERFRTWVWRFACLAFLPCGSAYGEALFLERFDYDNGELTEASSRRWTPTTTDSANPNLQVVDGQLTWDFTGLVADPVNHGYYGAVFATSAISSGSLYTYFDLEVTEAPIGTENTAGIFLALWNGGNGYRSRVFIAAVPDGEGGIVPDRFRVGITKRSGSRHDAVYYPADWAEGTKLTVLVQSDFEAETVKLYIDPQAESDTHAVANDGAFLGMRGIAVRHRDESREGNNIGVFRVDNIAVTQTFGDVEAPPELPPGRVTVYGVPGGGISVNWSDNSNNESGFRVDRRVVGDADFATIAVVEANRTHYLDASPFRELEMEYRIVALGDTELSSGWGQRVQRYDDPPPLTAPVLTTKQEDGRLLLGFPAIPQVTYEVQESIDLENWDFFKYLQADSAVELSALMEAGESDRRFARVTGTRLSLPPLKIGLTEVFEMPENGTGRVFRLSDFGATPGVPGDDDAIAIRSAFAAMAFGDVLEVEGGNYHLKTTVTAPSGMTLRASSAGEAVFYTVGVSSAFRISPSSHDVTLAGFAIMGTDGLLSYGVDVGQPNQRGPERVWLKDLRIEGFARHGIRLRSTKHAKVENCRILNATNLGGGGHGYGVEVDGAGSNNNWITGCRIGPVIRHGVLLQYSTHNNLVENNTCFETTEDAYDLHGEDEYANELRFNLAYWDGDSSEVGTPAGFGVGNTGSTHDNSGPGNWIHHNEVRGYQIGVEVIQGSHVQFIDSNDLQDNAVAGIMIHNGGGNSLYLRGNSISGSGVGVRATRSAGFVAEGNTIGGNDIGIMTTSDMTDYRITGNDLRGNGMAKDLGSDLGEFADNLGSEDPFAHWNDLEPESWWMESTPYTCQQKWNESSPWLDAGLIDLGGSDSLSLIRYYGNGSYLRYGHMGFSGCTELDKYPGSFHLDPPADPTWYSLGDLDIHVDIARVPEDATGWFMDDGSRVDMSMAEAIALLNTYVAAYFRRISQDRFRITFQAGHEFVVPGDGSPIVANNEQFRLAGACPEGCAYGAPGGLNRILLNDVDVDAGGSAYNGWSQFGLVLLRGENMETIVHEMGHGWMSWPHSFTDLPWLPSAGGELQVPNPYSNFYDIMSGLITPSDTGWTHDLPSTLAINRYSAGWIDPEEVALHLEDSATYTLSKPFEEGYQFLVIHSGRRFAFTTLEVLEERTEPFKVSEPEVYDPSVPGGLRPRGYEGVLVSRYDQTAGTGASARFGPALYNRDNPNFLTDVGWGRDDFSLIPNGESREIGGGVTVTVAKNSEGSYEVTVSGGRVASFERWCGKIWFRADEYDTGCFLDEAVWE